MTENLIKRKIIKAVVTGAQGFIGRALTTYLLRLGTAVTGVDLAPPRETSCPALVLDIKKQGALNHLLDEETVLFHLAGHANVPESVRDPRKDFLNNTCGLFEILESVRQTGCQLIFPSTASIFDPSNPLPLSEKALVEPTSPYAAAKAAGENYCVAYYRSFGLRINIARMFSVYGQGMYRFAIHDLVRKIQQNSQELVILGDGNQIRDYLHIDDTVRGLLAIATRGEPGEDYNLASGIPVKLYDLARQIATFMGVPNIRIIPTGQSFPGDIPRWYADIAKIRELGFSPKVSLEDGLQRTIKWLINQPAG